jgi:hypothetical protein
MLVPKNTRSQVLALNKYVCGAAVPIMISSIKKRLVISIIYTLHSVKKEVINAFEARA